MAFASAINEASAIPVNNAWVWDSIPGGGTGGKPSRYVNNISKDMSERIGTGGALTPIFYLTLEEKRVVCSNSSVATVHELDNDDTVTEDFARVKSILKLSITDLAQSLGVSRQAIYNWMSGTPISRDNRLKLIRLIKAADVIAASGKTLSPLQLDRTLPGGKTLLEKIAAGDDGAEAASSLLDMLRKEAHQRALIDQRLAEHDRPVRDTSDYGVPSFDEG